MTRRQLTALNMAGVIDREFRDTYRLAAVPRSSERRLRAALLWAGEDAAAAGRSAGELSRLEGVRAAVPEIVVTKRAHAPDVVIHESRDRSALMVRYPRGLRVTGIEPTLVALASILDGEAFEIACEDARRRRLTSVPALRAYSSVLDGRAGAA
ncbi:MAG: hypothetical protein ACT4OX_10760 [Actinomycetota bacterium]